MKEIRIYFEGADALRDGFRQFFSEIHDAAQRRGIKLRPIACGAKFEADFHTGQKLNRDDWNILLRDSEGPDPPNRQSVFWMVQLMESWFLADPDTLEKFYGKDFQRNALKRNPQVEQIPKDDVEACLKSATRKTKKGEYHKTGHAPKILKLVDSKKVRNAAPRCEHLFRELLAKIEEMP